MQHLLPILGYMALRHQGKTLKANWYFVWFRSQAQVCVLQQHVKLEKKIKNEQILVGMHCQHF